MVHSVPRQRPGRGGTSLPLVDPPATSGVVFASRGIHVVLIIAVIILLVLPFLVDAFRQASTPRRDRPVMFPIAQVVIFIVPAYVYLLAVVTKPENKPAPLAGRNLGRDLQHERHEVRGRAEEELARLRNDGPRESAHPLQSRGQTRCGEFPSRRRRGWGQQRRGGRERREGPTVRDACGRPVTDRRAAGADGRRDAFVGHGRLDALVDGIHQLEHLVRGRHGALLRGIIPRGCGHAIPAEPGVWCWGDGQVGNASLMVMMVVMMGSSPCRGKQNILVRVWECWRSLVQCRRLGSWRGWGRFLG